MKDSCIEIRKGVGRLWDATSLDGQSAPKIEVTEISQACLRCFFGLPQDTSKPCSSCGACRNCASLRKPQRRGRCPACAQYLRRAGLAGRTGRERPLELVEANIYRKINKELELRATRMI